ncbi:MAG: enolase-phosphatase E1 [Alphaproteobacteria bacterium]|jgi:enolase-phosphatase E1
MTAILTDIEGTTGSIAFVRDVLFPYARERLPAFINDNADTPQVATLIRDAARDAGLESLTPDEATTVFLAWMEADLKVTTLKTLQGLIWELGYRDGVLKGHVYDDAVAGLKRWHEAGLPIYVYSSGSISAQRLLFKFSEHGDLASLFTGYFDTTVGLKTEVESYTRICTRIGQDPGATVFLTDSPAEISAAHAAGLKTVWLTRPDTPSPDGAPTEADLNAVSFIDIDPEALTAG